MCFKGFKQEKQFKKQVGADKNQNKSEDDEENHSNFYINSIEKQLTQELKGTIKTIKRDNSGKYVVNPITDSVTFSMEFDIGASVSSM